MKDFMVTVCTNHISRVKKGWDAKLLFGESEDELAVPGEWKIIEFRFGKKWRPKTT